MGSVEPSYAEQNGSFLARLKNWKGHLRTENKEDNKKAWDSNTKLFSHQWHMFTLCVFSMQGKLQFCAKRFQALCVTCHLKMQS